GGRGAEETERDRKMSSTARALQGTPGAIGRMRGEPMGITPSGQMSADFNNMRGLSSRLKERLPARLSLATKGSGSQEGVTESRVSERLATPSSGGRLSMKGSGLPVPIGSSADGSKLRRVAGEGRGLSTKQRQT
ncbi:hypothetical protein LOTGIDRAFT_154211, partial [Lottia gigantea]